jgi:hypothetical protein
MSSTPIIGGDDTEAGVDKQRNNVMPFPPCLRKTVQKYDSALSIASGDVVNAQARLDIGHAVRPDMGALIVHRDDLSLV